MDAHLGPRSATPEIFVPLPHSPAASRDAGRGPRAPGQTDGSSFTSKRRDAVASVCSIRVIRFIRGLPRLPGAAGESGAAGRDSLPALPPLNPPPHRADDPRMPDLRTALSEETQATSTELATLLDRARKERFRLLELLKDTREQAEQAAREIADMRLPVAQPVAADDEAVGRLIGKVERLREAVTGRLESLQQAEVRVDRRLQQLDRMEMKLVNLAERLGSLVEEAHGIEPVMEEAAEISSSLRGLVERGEGGQGFGPERRPGRLDAPRHRRRRRPTRRAHPGHDRAPERVARRDLRRRRRRHPGPRPPLQGRDGSPRRPLRGAADRDPREPHPRGRRRRPSPQAVLRLVQDADEDEQQTRLAAWRRVPSAA